IKVVGEQQAIALAATTETAAFDLGVSLAEATLGMKAPETLEELRQAAQSTPVQRIVNKILRDAIDQKATAISITSEASIEGWEVQFRKDGAYKPYAPVHATIVPAIIARLKIMAGFEVNKLPEYPEVAVNIRTHGYVYRCGFTIYRHGGAEEAVVMIERLADEVIWDVDRENDPRST
ncbi:MAG: hypothetical protein Q7S16_03620, partial [bacterium]|nr:hypothetical protein [bacterium]